MLNDNRDNDNRDNDNHDNDCHAIKILYIFSVERKMVNGAQGSGNLFSGLQKFTPCPERKNKMLTPIKTVDLAEYYE